MSESYVQFHVTTASMKHTCLPLAPTLEGADQACIVTGQDSRDPGLSSSLCKQHREGSHAVVLLYLSHIFDVSGLMNI